jgi:hypothetical protein
MAGMRDYSGMEIDLVRKSFGGRYALRDRCYFEMPLQAGFHSPSLDPSRSRRRLGPLAAHLSS